MLSKTKSRIYVATRHELRTPSYYNRLWIAARNAAISRRSWLDEIADAIRDFDGSILDELGLDYPIPDIDEVFGNDSEMRWFGYYLKENRFGYPFSTSQKFERLRMVDLYFKIRHPDIARHFGR